MQTCTILVLLLPLVLADNLFIKANNKFTPQLYKEIAKTTSDNLLLSPLSAEIALSFVQAGAKGETAEELRQNLHFPNDQTQIESAIKTILPKLKTSDSYNLYTANKIYIREGSSIRQTFKDIATNVFGTGAEEINFLEVTEAARTINGWVQQQTNDKIVDLVDPNVINNRTRSVLVNSLYFKADWLSPFELFFTDKTNFYKSSKDAVLVDTMHSQPGQLFHYSECHHTNAKLLELPFKGEEASLTIILPNEREGLANLENHLEKVFSPHNFTNILVKVALPKFRIESKINLKPVLKNLGIKRVFDPQSADLSGIAGEPGDLFIDKILQKTFMDVNEKGVEAAAATVGSIADSISAPDTQTFTADHPFVFYVKVKGAIVFAGHVTNPIQ